MIFTKARIEHMCFICEGTIERGCMYLTVPNFRTYSSSKYCMKCVNKESLMLNEK